MMSVKVCSFCNSTFTKVEHLKRHERSHTGEKPYECEICHKRFSRRDVLNRHFKSHHDSDGTKVAATRLQPRPTEPVSPPQDTIIAQPTNLRDSSVPPDPASTNSSRSGAETPDDTNNILQQSSNLNYALHLVDPPSPSSSNDRGLCGTPPNRQQQPAITDQETHHSFSLPDFMPTLSEDAIYDPGMLSCLDGGSLQVALADGAEAVVTADESGQRPQKRVCLSDHEMSQIMTNYANRTWQPPPMGHTPDWLSMLDTDMASTDDRSAGAVWPVMTPLGIQHPDRFHTLHRRTHRKPSLGSDIPDERFAKVSKLWSKTGERPWQLMQTLWSDVVNAPEDNIFSESGSDQDHLDGSSSTVDTAKDPDKLDDRRRMDLTKEYGVQVSSQLRNMHLPTPDMLDICIDTYFQRFHHLMPIIHKPSFSSRKAHNMILFPMLLIGMKLLDSERTRSYVEVHLLNAIKKCDAALSRSWTRSDATLLLQVLTSAVLLLSCARTLEEHVHSRQAFALYAKTLSVAQQHGLFESHKGQPLSVVLDRGQMDSSTWKAWARVESAKRVISSLIMSDALFASNIGSGPIIRADTIHIYVPCSTLLFAATDAERWAQLEAITPSLHHTTLDFRAYETKLPAELSLSSIAMTTLMSAVWLRFADARHRLLLKSDIMRQPTLFPREVYEEDASGIALVRLLRNIQSTFREDLSRSNPNHIVFWHKMCMSIFANIELFEIAAGRDGAEEGKVALEYINTWAQTSFARQACLHAAQTYAAMSRRRVADGTAFQTEMAIFQSALVLGLYCYAAPASLRENVSSPGLAPYELLDDVDWDQLGDCGLHAPGVSCARSLTAAELFVMQGGAITFSGGIHEGGFGSSRRIFLAYIGLLEEVGKWKAGEYCRILRLMSDSNLDLGMH